MQVFNLLAQQEFDPDGTSKRYSAPSEKAMSAWHAGSRVKSAPIIVIHTQQRSISASRRGTNEYPARQSGGHARFFVVHPAGESRKCQGPERTLLFRVRYGTDMVARHMEWLAGRTGRNALRTASISGAAQSRSVKLAILSNLA